MVTYGLILENFYICTCKKESDIVFNCGHSYCAGCIAKILYIQEFNEKSIYIFYKEKDPQIWLEMKFECPKCLTISEIGNLF